MKKTLLTVVAGTVALSCLAYAQPPQGAKETVVIKKESAPKPPGETLQAPGSTPKPKVSRDPFSSGGAVAPEPAPVNPVKPLAGPKPGPAPAPGPAPVPAKQEVKEVVIAPQVSVKGILLSRTGNRAIVEGPKSTFIVKPGDKLGDYKVTGISKKSVTFAYKDKKFPIKLEDEFAAK